MNLKIIKTLSLKLQFTALKLLSILILSTLAHNLRISDEHFKNLRTPPRMPHTMHTI